MNTDLRASFWLRPARSILLCCKSFAAWKRSSWVSLGAHASCVQGVIYPGHAGSVRSQGQPPCSPSRTDGTGLDEFPNLLDKPLQGLRALIAFKAIPHGYLPALGFLVADDQHVGHLLGLRLADFGPHFLVSVIQLDSRARLSKPGDHLTAVLLMPLRDRNDTHLNRCQPDGKRPGIMLDQNPHEALDRAKEGPMQHDRLMRLAVRPDVTQIKSLGKGEVELYGGKLPWPADRVNKFDVDLRAVEHRLPFHSSPLHRLGAHRFN